MTSSPHLLACGTRGASQRGRFLLQNSPGASASGLFAACERKRTAFVLVVPPEEIFEGFDRNSHSLVPLGAEHFACIDRQDAAEVSQISWWLFSSSASRHNFYAKGKIEGKKVYLHRFILRAPKDLLVDHINRNTLDCRRGNLRLATPLENRGNERPRANSCGFRGVLFRAGRRFSAQLAGKYLGSYDTAEEAAKAYDAAARQHFGDFAVLNFPKDVSP